MFPDAKMELPYEGGKEMLFVEDVDNREFLEKMFTAIYEELPESKKKKWTNYNLRRWQRHGKSGGGFIFD